MKTESGKIRIGSLLLLSLLIVGVGAIVIISACSESTKPEPEPEPDDVETLLLSDLHAAIVKGGMETVVATSTEGGQVTATSGDPSVASVVQDDNLIHINGVDYGRTKVTFAAENGHTREIPVTVYDPQVLDNGELQIKFVKDYELLFVSKIGPNSSFWLPSDEDFSPLGVIVNYQPGPPDYPVAVVKASPGSNALAPPDSFSYFHDLHHRCEKSGTRLKMDQPFLASFWTPVAPPGYKALGIWGQLDPGGHPYGLITGLHPCHFLGSPLVCVRKDLVADGAVGTFPGAAEGAPALLMPDTRQPYCVGGGWFLYAPDGYSLIPGSYAPVLGPIGDVCPDPEQRCFGGNYYYWRHSVPIAFWAIEPRSTAGEQFVLLPTGTAVAAVEPWPSSGPRDDPVMNVLRVELPKLGQSEQVHIVPEMTSLFEPTEDTVPVAAWEIVIPYLMIDDEYLTPEEQLSTSPLYRLERQDYYKPKVYTPNYNKSPFSWTYSIEYGLKQSTITEVWTKHKIEISATAGINIKGIFKLQTTVNVSRELGYKEITGIDEWVVDTQEFQQEVPPNSAACVWQKISRFILKRHDGTEIVEVNRWEIPTKTHVLTMYP